MAVSPDFLDYVLEQLESLGGVAHRRMFGAVGLYRHELFFGVVDDDLLYLKTDDLTRPEFEAAGGEPFRPYGDHRTASFSTMPVDALEDPDEFQAWTRKALEAAERAKAKKRKKKA
jgi:DNA transformation protein